jgi:ankyrin repeat protein
MASYLGILPRVQRMCRKTKLRKLFTSPKDTDLAGQTAVHHATEHGEYLILEYLIAQGANVHLRGQW